MIPADQRLATADVAGGEVDMRLVIERELIFGDGFREFGEQGRRAGGTSPSIPAS